LRRPRRGGWPRGFDGWRVRPHPEAVDPDPRGAGDRRPARVALPDEVRVRLSELHRNRGRRTRATVRPAFAGERRGDPGRGTRGRPATSVRLQARDPPRERVRRSVDHPRDGDGTVRAGTTGRAGGRGTDDEKRWVPPAG